MNPFFDLLTDRLSEKGNRLLFALFLICILSFIALQVPIVRLVIIDIIELFLHRKIDFESWESHLLQYDFYLLILASSFLVLVVIDKGNHISNAISAIERIFITHKWLRGIAIILPWMIIIFLFVTDNINNPNFWFDESGQFWMAKGLNHFSSPLDKPGNIIAVVSNNETYNLDPGGFTILLHFWTMISTTPIFLRFLPIIFFILSMIFVSKLCLLWYPNNILSYFAGLILLFSKLLSHYAFELRPYSMELFTAILSMYFCYKISLILNNRKYAIIAGLSSAILITSRYPAILAIGTLVCIILFEVIFHSNTKNNKKNFLYFSTPIAICSFAIYFFMLRKQNPGVNSPAYTNYLMFKTGNIAEILFSRSSLSVYIPFLALLLLFILTYKKGVLKKYGKYIIYTLILNLVFLGLSIFGKHPWAFDTKWDITTHAIFVLSILPLLFIIMNIVNLIFSNRIMVQLLFSITIVITSAAWVINYQFKGNDSVYDNYINCGVSGDEKILTNINASSTIRYLFEYGPLKNNDIIYRNISWFDDNLVPYSSYSLESLDNLDQYDYLILTQYTYERSTLESLILKSSNWVDCSIKKSSQMFENTK